MAKTRKKHGGRSKGSRNKGYFYRESRGYWVESTSMKPLLDASGQKITDSKAEHNVLVAAYARHLEQAPKAEPLPVGSVTVGTLATKYILAIRGRVREKTLKIRQKYLLAFCDDGYQTRLAESVTREDITQWLATKKTWSASTKRMAIQAIRAMVCWGTGEANEKRLAAELDKPLLTRNPIAKIKTPKAGKRIVYLTEHQEEELLKGSKQVLKTAVKVMIRTGMRPGEFAAVTAAKCIDDGEAVVVTLGEETKTRKGRIIKVKDPTVLEMFRCGIARWSTGPIFRTAGGLPHDEKSLRRNFRLAKQRAESRGVRFDDKTSIYACRHTFAKRCLNGTWGNKISLVLLAQFMGNSVEVCRNNYLNWSDEAITHEWDAIA